MNDEVRGRVAWIIAAAALTLGLVTSLFVRYDPGIRLAVSDGGLVVRDVSPVSQAARDGVEPGMRVVTLNDQVLIQLPQYGYPEFNPDFDPGQAYPSPEPTPLLIGPAVPTPVELSADELFRLSQARIDSADFATEGMLGQWDQLGECCLIGVYYPGPWTLSDASQALIPGIAILLIGAWSLLRGRAGESLRPMAWPIATATATPFLVQPPLATGSAPLIVLGGLVATAAMIPLALALGDRIEGAADRRFIQIAIAMLALVSVVTVLMTLTVVTPGDQGELLRWVATGAIPLVPGLAAAGPLDLSRLRSGGKSARNVLQSTEFALAGATPFFALATDRPPYLWPIGFWLLAVALAGRFTIRPLARLATRAQLQRDLIVAATEAERARLAADIHDDALQELTLLVRRLETAGDNEGAELGRTVADRLRAICGDLRLPILDDLGVGPALDWLVLRIERLAGGEVRLERDDGTRPPADVELAIFRVAQEALANAVKHGQPPIVVRYRSTDHGVSLSIDDAGPGISEDAGAAAETGGHFGLLNMQQRADQIGAILDIRRWPSGGTHVALDWRPR